MVGVLHNASEFKSKQKKAKKKKIPSRNRLSFLASNVQ